MPDPKLKILLVDDQILFAESLRTFLNNYADDMTVTGVARNGREAVAMADAERPDIILMDIRMPEMDGVEAVRNMKPKYPELKIIMLTTYDEDALVRSALLAGASGYLLKDISPKELIASIRALKSGIMQISPEAAKNLVQSGGEKKRPLMSQPGRGQSSASSGSAGCRIHHETTAEAEPFKWLDDLTRRERDIFSLVAAGYDNDQIADKLNLAVQTVRNQVSTIYAKLGVKDRFEIIRMANRMP
ncbi:MAG: response regulator transcription factor [Spirochaetaceae bacterium]|jgi:DNA-binding NarL/FixJ family response regulator|nr:response regulator transcription factor [Spirochaetaceae bacterium]